MKIDNFLIKVLYAFWYVEENIKKNAVGKYLITEGFPDVFTFFPIMNGT